MKPTARQRALPGLIAEANKRLAAIEECANGLKQLLERRGKMWIIYELIQNAWDTKAKNVVVTIETVPSTAQVWLTVDDDNPAGFTDLTHTYRVFAPSEKKGDPTLRGRFDLGCKLALACCLEATITSTSGTYHFTEKGRRRSGLKTEAGSVFRGRLPMTRAELSEIENQVFQLLPPTHVNTVIKIKDGTRNTEAFLVSRTPFQHFTAALMTEIADEEGFLRRRPRTTRVNIHEASPAFLYELGIPVMPLEGNWSLDVQQKLPLGFERDGAPPAYVAALQSKALGCVANEMAPEDFTTAWVAEAVQNPDVTPEALNKYLTAKHGDKFVIADVNNPESNRQAVANGYALIHGGSEAKGTWSNIKKHQLAAPSSHVFPPPKKSSAANRLRFGDG